MTPPILITIPLCAADLPLAESLLKHLSHLGPIQNHGVLFVADRSLTKDQIDPLLKLAEPSFPVGGELVRTPIDLPQGTPLYPHGHNLRFETAIRHIEANRKVPFLWLDPHCVPTRKGWLNEIESEYRAHAHLKPVMGQVLTPAANGTAFKLVSGTAIYPHELPKRVRQRLVAQRGTEWEKSCADILVPIAHPTQLIWVHPITGNSELPNPPSVASLVHTVRAREYAAKLRGEPVKPRGSEPTVVVPSPPTPPPPPEPKPEPVKIVEPLKPPVVDEDKAQVTRTNYYHSGDLGDIIYALAAIRLAGGGGLLLGPKSRRTPPPANPMRQPVFDLISPLLSAQPYLTRVKYTDTYPTNRRRFENCLRMVTHGNSFGSSEW